MDTRWLEDFLVLAETGSFTRSAELRHLTQPAFSRRIKALETWLGADLIDRTTWPTRLTPAGEMLRDKARLLVGELSATRNQLRGLQAGKEQLTLAMPHTLSFGFVPGWLAREQPALAGISWQLLTHNVHDAVLALTEGQADLLLCYHHPRHPVELPPGRYAGLLLGEEVFRPYSVADGGQPRWRLPGEAAAPLPFIAYGANAYLRRMVELILQRAPAACALQECFETDMAEVQKALVLEGHGLAFLPQSTVQRELASGQLLAAGGEEWSLAMEIRLYRDLRHEQALLDDWWRSLATRYPAI